MEKTNFRKIINSNKYRFIVLGDPHIDSDYCDKKLLKGHLNYALANNIDVYCIGDLLDLMQSKGDHRASGTPQKIRTGTKEYFNWIVDYATDFLRPYKDIIKFISYGNHETAMIKFHNVDLLDIIVNNLKYEGANVTLGTYEGWWQFRLNDSTSKYNFKTAYHHGHGSSGITKGLAPLINSLKSYGDLDMLIHGHLHTELYASHLIETLNNKGNISKRKVNLIRTPSYKYHQTGMGWAVEKGIKQDVIGAVEISIQYDKIKGINFQITSLNNFYD